MTVRVQAVGECMIEIARTPSGVTLGYAGDTYNTAVYASRVARQLGVAMEVWFLTGVGVEAETQRMRQRWLEEHVGDDAIEVPGAAPGLYLIATDSEGERTFTSWRRDSAAAQLFAKHDWIEHLRGDYLYLSGVSLQVMAPDVQAALVERLRGLRRRGTKVVFDSNYRASGWPDAQTAADAMALLLGECDFALVTLEDEMALGTCHDAGTCAGRLFDLGVSEVVVKLGREGAVLGTAADSLVHARTTPRAAVDTTGAGDSFNGAYLAARIAGFPMMDAADLANRLAGEVVTRPGAIVDTTPPRSHVTG